MRMARVNVYLPDDLAEEARDAGLNVSGLAQDAIRDALALRSAEAWLAGVLEMKRPDVDLITLLAAVRDARDDLDRGRE